MPAKESAVHAQPTQSPKAESSSLADLIQGSGLGRLGSVTLLTTMPRGGLQVMYSQALPAGPARDYSAELHAHDAVAWRAISTGQPARSAAVEDFDQSKIYQQLLRPLDIAHTAAARVESPALQHCPGAIVLMRTQRQGAFTDADMSSLSRLASQLATGLARRRDERRSAEGAAMHQPRPPMSPAAMDAGLKLLLPATSSSTADATLQANLLRDAEARVSRIDDRVLVVDRVALHDARQERWNFRVEAYPSYPALAEGPVLFYCPTPSCDEWELLRGGDFPGDPEMARLIPAVRYVAQHFRRRANLHAIAQSAGLSPFHFHRQFTRLLGITPKNLTLDFQIDAAKRELLAGENDLATIASECGFAHQSHFTSRFRQAVGLTPTRWRRIAQEQQRQQA